MIKLEKNTSYINSGNYFSKSKIIQKLEKTYDFCLFLVEDKKDINNYAKILDWLYIPYKVVDNMSTIVDFVYNKSGFFIAGSSAFEKDFPQEKQLEYESLLIQKDNFLDLEKTLKKLNDLGYSFSEYQKSGTYKRSGDVLKIISPDGKGQYNVSLWGDIVDEIQEIFFLSDIKKTTKTIEKLFIGENISLDSYAYANKKTASFLDFIPESCFVVLDNLDFNPHYDKLCSSLKNFCSLDFVANKKLQIIDLEIDSPKINSLDSFKKVLQEKKVEIFTRNIKTINNFLEYNSIEHIKVVETKLNNLKSFSIKNKQFYICDDIISKIFTKKRVKKSLSADIDLLLKISPGDYVVHIEHGIGIFKNIIKKELPSRPRLASPEGRGKKQEIVKEFIEIEYANKDKLFVPITEVSRINKYLGEDNPKLTGLNTKQWEKKLKQASKQVEEIAHELIEIYANRKLKKAFAFIPDIKKEEEFQNSFPYTYTDDQANAIEDVLEDMQKQKAMDRLIVGDVGFGKTEIAFNAIYRAFLNKKQSILISPLVVLAYEHYEKALDRFKSFGLKIGVLTRLEKQKTMEETIKKIESGELDLVIGTHKLLSDKINFKNLGLIVVDEEHKFGVKDKEKIKSYKQTIDVLAMSATPIPRSLNMALSSIRDISILKTPPYGRQNIQTIVSRYSENTIEEAGNREFKRGGQMFFVHNRVSNIENYKTILQSIFPDKKIVVTHGQLPGDTLEKRIIDFKNKKYDILLSTTVIENGIDFSNVNTIIINDAEKFGLSQIHQLRGRVGRSDKKGYCYLLYKNENIKKDTAKRLKTIVQYSYLGAGFELAIKDLEIRGGGDLLGFRQSGQSRQIGVNLFLKMIEEKMLELKNNLDSSLQNTQKTKDKVNTSIDINISISIDDNYFNSLLDKINFYREIESIEDIEELEEIKDNFKLIASPLPQEAINLFNLLKLKLIAKQHKITTIKKVGINYQIDFYDSKDKNTIENLKNFLKLDKQVKFAVISHCRLRSPVKNFENEEDFIAYMIKLFEKKITNKKIRLKK